jgi:hypothetical protein
VAFKLSQNGKTASREKARKGGAGGRERERERMAVWDGNLAWLGVDRRLEPAGHLRGRAWLAQGKLRADHKRPHRL